MKPAAKSAPPNGRPCLSAPKWHVGFLFPVPPTNWGGVTQKQTQTQLGHWPSSLGVIGRSRSASEGALHPDRVDSHPEGFGGTSWVLQV